MAPSICMRPFLLLLLLLGLLVLTVFAKEDTFNARLAIQGVPKKVIYIDWINLPADQGVIQAIQAGYNVIILAFWMKTGPTDYLTEWTSLDEGSRAAVMSQAHQMGAVVLVSAGGSEETPYDSISGSEYGTQAAQFALKYNLDGVDFDMENFDQPLRTQSLNATQTIEWLADATNSARSVLGDSGIITHAPQAPYFGPLHSSNTWTGSTGGYSAVYAKSSSATDWYNIQFYNQGGTCYSTYQGLFFESTSDCNYLPGTSIKEISSYGVPLSKIVLGKYVEKNDASDGWVDPTTLGKWIVQQQSSLGWSAGVMGWEYHNNESVDSQWIDEIYPSS